MPYGKEVGYLLLTIVGSCGLVLVAPDASAQSVAAGGRGPALYKVSAVAEQGTWNAPLSTAARSAILPASDRSDAVRRRAGLISQARFRFEVAGAPGFAKTPRSKRRTTLIFAAIGGAIGAAGGVYVSEATGGDTDPWGVPGFAGIGAAVGAITGFVAALL